MWQLAPRQAIRPDDGLLVRRWSRSCYDPATRLEHTADRYELLRDGEVVEAELHERSPATRSYGQDEIALVPAARLRRRAGPARPLVETARRIDTLFTVVGTRP